MATKLKPLKVSIREKHIRKGVKGDCHRCAASLALTDATGDTEANVYRRDWLLFVEVHGRHIHAPEELCEFVGEFDYGGKVEPFEFELPNMKHPDWKEQCYSCEELFDGKELDDEGNCPECSND